MKLTEKQRKEFERLVRPLMNWLGDPKNHYPHVHVIVDCTKAELSEGVNMFSTNDYVRD